jgi:hypothetical protein
MGVYLKGHINKDFIELFDEPDLECLTFFRDSQNGI